MSQNDSFDNRSRRSAEESDPEGGGGFQPPHLANPISEGFSPGGTLSAKLTRNLSFSAASLAPQEDSSEPSLAFLPFPAASVDPESSLPAVRDDSPLDFAQPTPVEPAPELLLQPWPQPEIVPPRRIPHLGHFAMLAALAAIGLFCATVLVMVGIHFHLFGVTTMDKAATEVHYMLGSEAILYLVTLALGLILFPLFWKKSFFAGIQWRGEAALKLSWRLPDRSRLLRPCRHRYMAAARPGKRPHRRDVSRSRRSLSCLPSASRWRSFFEEMFFRGFLLPAFCTAFDWIADEEAEKLVSVLGLGPEIAEVLMDFPIRGWVRLFRDGGSSGLPLL